MAKAEVAELQVPGVLRSFNPVTGELVSEVKTATPSVWRISKPAPFESTSGTTPRMKAKDVIKIGRRRNRQASTVASKSGFF